MTLADKVTNITWTCQAMPNQADVTLDDGTRLYFRARHGYWRLHENNLAGVILAEGADSLAGWWSTDEAEAVLLEAMSQL